MRVPLLGTSESKVGSRQKQTSDMASLRHIGHARSQKGSVKRAILQSEIKRESSRKAAESPSLLLLEIFEQMKVPPAEPADANPSQVI
jgi:hypothetical protein